MVDETDIMVRNDYVSDLPTSLGRHAAPPAAERIDQRVVAVNGAPRAVRQKAVHDRVRAISDEFDDRRSMTFERPARTVPPQSTLDILRRCGAPAVAPRRYQVPRCARGIIDEPYIVRRQLDVADLHGAVRQMAMPLARRMLFRRQHANDPAARTARQEAFHDHH